MVNIKYNIEKILKEKGIKKGTLADAIGVKPSSLSAALDRDMRISTVARIAAALDVPIVEFFRELDDWQAQESPQEDGDALPKEEQTKEKDEEEARIMAEAALSSLSVPVRGFLKVGEDIVEVRSFEDLVKIVTSH